MANVLPMKVCRTSANASQSVSHLASIRRTSLLRKFLSTYRGRVDTTNTVVESQKPAVSIGRIREQFRFALLTTDALSRLSRFAREYRDGVWRVCALTHIVLSVNYDANSNKVRSLLKCYAGGCCHDRLQINELITTHDRPHVRRGEMQAFGNQIFTLAPNHA